MRYSSSIETHIRPPQRCDIPGISETHNDERIPRHPSGKTESKSYSRAIELTAFSLILLGALVAAWIHLRHASIWYDEAVTLLITSGHAKIDWSLGLQQFQPTARLGRILLDLYRRDVHPPLYFWTLALWRVVFGASLEVARALSVVFTLATLVLLYRYAKAVCTRWAFVPVAIYAISSASLRYAYDARPYAMACFLVVSTLLLAHRKSKWAGICGTACAATHYFAVLCVLPILAIECLRSWKTNRRWVLLTAISFVACCSPLLILVRAHIGARPQQYPGFSSFYLECCALLKGAIAGAMPKTWLPGWALVLFFGACFAMTGSWWAHKKADSSVPVAYSFFLLGFLALAIATNKSLVKMPTDYYLGVGAPLLALLIGLGLNVFPRALPISVLVLLLGSMAALPMNPTVDYRLMTQEMRSECKDCPIVAGFGYSGAIPACVLYEAKGMRVLLLHPGETPESVVDRAGKRDTVFLVPANEPSTTQTEHELVEQFPSIPKNGYFELDLAADRSLHSLPGSRTAQIIRLPQSNELSTTSQ